ncbi:MAG TPA: hypothetical protein VKQ27_06270 [Acetobacteraceae bacterium]|nr:hypothetical protein [Acetobacteraceae bacterium]
MRRVGVVGIGPPRHVAVLPGVIAARIRIATVAARVTTIVGGRMMAIIAIGMPAAVVVEAARIVMVEVAAVILIEVAAVILIEAARIVVVEAAAVIAVEPPVAAIAGIRIMVPPHHVPMRVLPLRIQLVVICAHGGAVVPGICVAGRSHLPEHLANAATALGLTGHRGSSAIWRRLILPYGCRSGSCIAGLSLTR